MKNLLLITCAALPLFACGGGAGENETTAEQTSEMRLPGADVLIDFDQVNGTAVATDSVVDTTYSNAGVTFSCVVCASGHAFARSLGNGTQGVSLVDPQSSVLPFFDSRDGAVTATFTTPRTWVSIDAAPVLAPEYLGTPVGMPWIEAYDANGNLLMKTLYPTAYGQPGYGDAQTLTVSSSTANIKLVRFSSRYVTGTPPVYGTFDNLRFNGNSVVLLPHPRLPL